LDLPDDNVSAAHVDTTSGRIGNEVDETWFDEFAGCLVLIGKAEFAQAFHKSTELGVEGVFATDNDIVFVLRVLHAAGDPAEDIIVDRHGIFVVTSAPIAFADAR